MSNYYSGTAGSFSALKDTIITVAGLEGWSVSGDQISKDGAIILFASDPAYLRMRGRITSGSNTGATTWTQIGDMFGAGGNISFPCNYEIFIFDLEVYVIVNYSGDYYQFLTFGKTRIQGTGGTGCFLAATRAEVAPASGTGNPISIGVNGGPTASVSRIPAAPFGYAFYQFTSHQTCFVNTGLNVEQWGALTSSTSLLANPVLQTSTLSPLLAISPSSWNSESPLLPLRFYKRWPENFSSLVLDLEYARVLRINNYDPGDIITIGSDQWKVFPYFRKNLAVPNGGDNINHTGTFGWAIRYEPD